MEIMDKNRSIDCIITNLRFVLGSLHRSEHLKENWYHKFFLDFVIFKA
jgi:hypothetical protein